MTDQEPLNEENQNQEETLSFGELQNEQMQKLHEEISELKTKYLSALAELENTRKRLQKEKQEMTKFAAENVLAEFLSPIDNFENALGFTTNMSDEIKNWAIGFKMLLGQFKDVLTSHGVTSFSSEGIPFDAELHEAVEVEEVTGVDEGIILKEFLCGYRRGDRVLRPARVKVSKKSNPDESQPSSSKENNMENNND